MSAAQYHNVMLSVTLKLCCQLSPAGQYHNAMLSVTQKLCCQLSSVAAAAQYFNAMLYGTFILASASKESNTI